MLGPLRHDVADVVLGPSAEHVAQTLRALEAVGVQPVAILWLLAVANEKHGGFGGRGDG